MKQFSRLLILAGLMIAVSKGAAAGGKPALSWHFAGTEAVRLSNSDAVLNVALKTTQAVALKHQIKGRIADWLPVRLGWTDHGWPGGTTFVRRSLQEVFANESIGHLEGADIATASWVVAVHLNEEEMEKWTHALLVFGRQIDFGEPQPLKVSGLSGWRIPAGKFGRDVCFVSHDEWLIIADSFETNDFAVNLASTLAKNGRPGEGLDGGLLKLIVDPAILGWEWVLPVVGEVNRVSATFSWMKESVRMSADVVLKSGFQPGIGNWKTPKEIIRDPIVSFTALRGARDWLAGFEAFGALPDALRPDQLFAWSRGDIAFVTDFAMPVANAEKAFSVLKKSVPESYNERILDYSLGEWKSATNMNRLLWRGLPVFVPYMSPVNGQDGGKQDYISGGIFPMVNEKDPKLAPQALFDQIENRDDLIYYDWEISGARIRAFEQATRFVNLVFSQKEKGKNTNGVKWMNFISESLGNAITEATVTGARELNIHRKSSIGFTGIELWMLAHWIDGKDFPAFPYNSPEKRGKKSDPATRPLPEARRVNDH